MRALAMSKFCQEMLRVSALAVCFALAFESPIQAQEQPQGVIRVGVNLVLVDATVKNKAGQIMADLMNYESL